MTGFSYGRSFLYGVQKEKVCIPGFKVIENPGCFLCVERKGVQYIVERLPEHWRLTPWNATREKYLCDQSILVDRPHPLIDLLPFCSKDETRQALMRPFTEGSYTYATCGRVAIRVDARSEYGPLDNTVNAGGVGWPIERLTRLLSPILPKETPQTKSAPCGNCEGKGKFDKCPDCEGKGSMECDLGHTHNCSKCRGRGYTKGHSEICQECKGTGMVTGDLYVRIGASCFNYAIVRKVLELPGIRIAPSVESKPTYFAFDGGDGLMMPVQITSPSENPSFEIPLVEMEVEK